MYSKEKTLGPCWDPASSSSLGLLLWAIWPLSNVASCDQTYKQINENPDMQIRCKVACICVCVIFNSLHELETQRVGDGERRRRKIRGIWRCVSESCRLSTVCLLPACVPWLLSAYLLSSIRQRSFWVVAQVLHTKVDRPSSEQSVVSNVYTLCFSPGDVRCCETGGGGDKYSH